jgi:hypothetical protein
VKAFSTVKVRNVLGPVKEYDPITPNRWQGEADCLVGPFSSRDVAGYFANSVVDFGLYEAFSQQVVPIGNAWFVEVNPVQERSEQGVGPLES